MAREIEVILGVVIALALLAVLAGGPMMGWGYGMMGWYTGPYFLVGGIICILAIVVLVLLIVWLVQQISTGDRLPTSTVGGKRR